MSRARWDEYQRVQITQEEESRREVQEVDNEVNQNWTVVYQTIARRMLKYLEDSEALKVSTRELREQVLSPNEPSVNIVRIARQARSEKHKKLFQIFSRQGAKEIPVASVARWEEYLRMLKVLQRECLQLSEAIENLSEKPELLANLIEGKMSLQKVASVKFQEKIFQELKDPRKQKKHKTGKRKESSKVVLIEIAADLESQQEIVSKVPEEPIRFSSDGRLSHLPSLARTGA